ncbi:MAG: hypothetical protein IJ938_04650 [Clostridia bacterium]|nr:hypothetical protein [Clostridia bacterium]
MVNKQNFINAVTQDIEMVKGDTLEYGIQLQGLEGAEPNIVFSCALNYYDDVLFNADLEDGINRDSYDAETDTATYSIRIAPEKTASLDLDRYYYDLQMVLGDDVITLMRGRLTLLYEVTKGA